MVMLCVASNATDGPGSGRLCSLGIIIIFKFLGNSRPLGPEQNQAPYWAFMHPSGTTKPPS